MPGIIIQEKEKVSMSPFFVVSLNFFVPILNMLVVNF